MKTLLLAGACALALAGCGQAAPPAQAQAQPDADMMNGAAYTLYYADHCPNGEAEIAPEMLIMARGYARSFRAPMRALTGKIETLIASHDISLEVGTQLWCMLMKPKVAKITADTNRRAGRQ